MADNFFCSADTNWQDAPSQSSENFLSRGVFCHSSTICLRFSFVSTALRNFSFAVARRTHFLVRMKTHLDLHICELYKSFILWRTEIDLWFLLNWRWGDRGDGFTFDNEPNRLSFGVVTWSLRSYSFRFERSQESVSEST